MNNIVVESSRFGIRLTHLGERKFSLIVVAAFACCLLDGSYKAHAVPIIVDQSYTAPVIQSHSLLFFKFDQEFTPTFSSLDVVELHLANSPVSGGENIAAEFQVNIRSGQLDGPVIGTSSTVSIPKGFDSGSDGLAQFIFASPVPLVPENLFIIDLVVVSGGEANPAIGSSSGDGGYPDGRRFINGISTPTDFSDVIFQTGLHLTPA